MAISSLFRNAGRIASLVGVTAFLALLTLTGAATIGADAAVNHLQSTSAFTPSAALRDLARARSLRPDISDPWLLSATYEDSINAGGARSMVLQALRLEPDNWQNWEELGRIEFQLGDNQAALKDFRQATRYSTGYEAHYELANAAFLLGDMDMFWRQMQTTLNIAPAGMVTNTLQEIVRLEGDQPQRLADILPAGRADVRAAAIEYLAGAKQLAVAHGLWQGLACPSYQATQCATAAYALVDADLQATAAAEATSPGKVEPAATGPVPTAVTQMAQIWNEALQRGVIAGPRLAVGAVTDPLFQFEWQDNGFGWRGGGPNVRRLRAATGNNIQIGLDGYEPSEETLLWQWLIVRPEARYNLSLQLRGESLTNAEGITAEITTPNGELIGRVAARPGAAWSTASSTISIPPKLSLLRLVLAYHRPLGVALMQGTVWIRKVDLTPAEAGQ